MKVRLRLSDVDRKRFDCPEWLELDPMKVSFREVIAMQRGFDVDGEVVAFDSGIDWRLAWLGRPVLDKNGEPVMVDALDEDGQPLLDDNGERVRIAKRVNDYGAALVGIWLALRRAGITLPLGDVADCDPERMALEIAPDEGDETDPGKGESDPATTS